jgi:hypothetical protein
VINSNHRLTVHEVSDEDGIYKTTFHEIIDEDGIYKTTFHEILTENCGMHRVAANFVPLLLGEEQKQNRVYVSKEPVDRANADDNFLNNIGTGYEIWVYGYDAETKTQS